MRWFTTRLASVLVPMALLGAWQYTTGGIGVGERPVLAGPAPGAANDLPTLDGPRSDPAAPDFSVVTGEPMTLSAFPELGRVGRSEPCSDVVAVAMGGPPAVGATTCQVHVDLGGAFATSTSPGRFQVWCQDEGLSFRPWSAVAREVRIVGSAAADFRTVVVLEFAPLEKGAMAEFATLRRDPSSAGGVPEGCPTLEALGTGLPIEAPPSDPFVPTPDGVLLVLHDGGVAVRPASEGVELVRLTPQVPPASTETSVEPAPVGDAQA